MLTLNDGRSELWQWDTGRKLDVDADCSQVHFSNKVFGRSIDVDVTYGVAIIPDVLLQTDKDLNVWAFVGTAENGYTKISKTFKVNRRNKPADYVFTPQEQITLKDATAILEEAKDVANDAMETAKKAEASSTQAAKSADAADKRATDAEAAATSAGRDAKTANDRATDAEASKQAAAQSAAAADKRATDAAKSKEDADRTANSIKDSMAQISENKEAVSKLKDDLETTLNSGFTLSFESGKALFDDKIIRSYDNGSISNPFPCGCGNRIRIKTILVGTLCIGFFDKNDNCISVFKDPDNTKHDKIKSYDLDAPTWTAYCRFSCYTRFVDTSGCDIAVINLASSVSANSIKIEEQRAQIDTAKVKIDKLNAFVEPVYYNLVNPDAITENASIVKENGSIFKPTQYQDCTDFILLKANTKYYVGGIFLNNFYAFYDIDKKFVSNPDATIEIDDDYEKSHGSIIVGGSDIYFRGGMGHGNIENVYISKFYKSKKPYGIVPVADYVRDRIRTEKLNGKRVLVLGDSISTDYYGSYRKWVTDLIDDGYLPSDTMNNSIHATGFVARYNSEENDFISRLEAVENPETYDLVIVFGGINDYIHSIPLGESGGNKLAEFKPAVDYFFEYLIQNFTQARIAVLRPLRTFNVYANQVGVKQDVYSAYIGEVARKYCLPVLNLTEESGFCPFIDTFKQRWTLIPSGFATPDGVHPNEEYERKYLAPMIWKFIEGLI